MQKCFTIEVPDMQSYIIKSDGEKIEFSLEFLNEELFLIEDITGKVYFSNLKKISESMIKSIATENKIYYQPFTKLKSHVPGLLKNLPDEIREENKNEMYSPNLCIEHNKLGNCCFLYDSEVNVGIFYLPELENLTKEQLKAIINILESVVFLKAINDQFESGAIVYNQLGQLVAGFGSVEKLGIVLNDMIKSKNLSFKKMTTSPIARQVSNF